jgi:hypothetical protein
MLHECVLRRNKIYSAEFLTNLEVKTTLHDCGKDLLVSPTWKD